MFDLYYPTDTTPTTTSVQADCLDAMCLIPDGSVDMVLCDLPYGTTACKWDSVIPFEPLWANYKRVIKSNGAIVLTASQPFTTALISSNMKDFRYSLVWEKEQATNFMQAHIQFGKSHEDVSVFYQKQPNYAPQMTKADTPSKSGGKNKIETIGGGFIGGAPKNEGSLERFPKSVLRFNRDRTGLHPTQKPVALMEYLIRTYTNEGDTVLDNCMGSGTTGVACANTGRKFIGIERDLAYFRIAAARIANASLGL